MMTSRALLFIFCVVLGSVQYASGGWTQTFFEDFNGTTLASQWIAAFHWSPDPVGNNELQIYSPDACNFTSTSLQIIANNKTGSQYTSGVITTKDRWTQTFGYFEFRARWPTAKGLRVAFSLLPQDTLIGNVNTIKF